MFLAFRVANLAFLKPDFEILSLAFYRSQKKRVKSVFFWLISVGKAWFWKNIVRAAYSLQTPHETSL